MMNENKKGIMQIHYFKTKIYTPFPLQEYYPYNTINWFNV